MLREDSRLEDQGFRPDTSSLLLLSSLEHGNSTLRFTDSHYTTSLKSKSLSRITIANGDLDQPGGSDECHWLSGEYIGIGAPHRHLSVTNTYLSTVNRQEVRDRISKAIDHDHLTAQPSVSLPHRFGSSPDYSPLQR